MIYELIIDDQNTDQQQCISQTINLSTQRSQVQACCWHLWICAQMLQFYIFYGDATNLRHIFRIIMYILLMAILALYFILHILYNIPLGSYASRLSILTTSRNIYTKGASTISTHFEQQNRFQYLIRFTFSYLYGTCLAPLAKASMTFPNAVRDRHRPPPASLLLQSTFSQLPKSIRCNLLLPPDTGEKKRKKKRERENERWSLGSHATTHANILSFYKSYRNFR